MSAVRIVKETGLKLGYLGNHQAGDCSVRVVFSTVLVVFSEACWLAVRYGHFNSGPLRSGKVEEFQGETWEKKMGAQNTWNQKQQAQAGPCSCVRNRVYVCRDAVRDVAETRWRSLHSLVQYDASALWHTQNSSLAFSERINNLESLWIYQGAGIVWCNMYRHLSVAAMACI